MTENGRDDHGAGAPHVVVVGGGVSGLAAAFYLSEAPVRVTVLEAGPRLGGQLRMAEVAGVGVDVGAETTYAPRAKRAGVFEETGLGGRLVLADVTSRAVWSRGRLCPLPPQHLGVPGDITALARSGLLSPEGLRRAEAEATTAPTGRDGDVTVAAYVGARFGQEVVERLVDPWIGGALSGRAENLSFEANMPTLVSMLQEHPSLTAASAALQPRPMSDGSPRPLMISTLTSGVGSLPPALAAQLQARGARVRTGAPVRSLTRAQRGWLLSVQAEGGVERVAADAVVLALPAGAAAQLLSGTTGAAAAVTAYRGMEYADVGVVTLAYPWDAFPESFTARGLSGYLSPAVDGHRVRETTFSSVKWRHLADRDVQIVRCHVGGATAADSLGRDDDDLVALTIAELAAATGVRRPPIASLVTRWVQARPQYTVGHLGRVAAIRRAVSELGDLVVCGAAYDGMGVATCLSTARKAVDELLPGLRVPVG